ncbi:MAG: sugar-binding transcriptional regulator [Pseudomonadota bacterium]
MALDASRRPVRMVSGEDTIIEAAWLYYHDGLNQNDIAARLGVSRATVVNYLQEARERGFVQINMADEAFSGHRLALQLKEVFGLQGALVIPDGKAGTDETANRVARAAARWLPSMLAPGDRLGVAWGKTIYDVAENLEPVATPDLTVLQLVGSMATPYGFSADVCSSYVARRLFAKCINLHVPAIVSSPHVADVLRREKLIANQLHEISHFNKTLFAVGSCLPDSHVVSSGVATVEELQWYIRHGATGVLCSRFIDRHGKWVKGPLDERLLGVSVDTMRKRETGILVSVGSDRVTAAVSAMRGGFATHLVTHQSSAEMMLTSGR